MNFSKKNKFYFGDRFVPTRCTSNFKLFELTEQPVLKYGPKNNKLLSLKREMNRLVNGNVFGAYPNYKKILSYNNIGPQSLYSYKNPLGILFKTDIRNHKICLQSKSQLPEDPYKILDAPELKNDYYLSLLDWSKTDQYLAVALGSSVYLWNEEEKVAKKLSTVASEFSIDIFEENYVSSVAWNPRDSQIAIGTNYGFTELRDCRTSQLISLLFSNPAHRIRLGPRVASLSWNSNVISSGCKSGVITHSDVRMKSSYSVKAHSQEVCGLKWCTNGKYLASGSNDNIIKIWPIETSLSHLKAQPIYCINQHRAAVKALAWRSNILASGGGSADQMIKFWDINTGACINSINANAQISSVIWSPTGQEILATTGFGCSRSKLAIWSYPKLHKIADLGRNSNRIIDAVLSLDGTSIVAAQSNETLSFWKVFENKKKKQVIKSRESTLNFSNIR